MAGAEPGLGQVRPGLDEAFFEVTDLRLETFLHRLGLSGGAGGGGHGPFHILVILLPLGRTLRCLTRQLLTQFGRAPLLLHASCFLRRALPLGRPTRGDLIGRAIGRSLGARARAALLAARGAGLPGLPGWTGGRGWTGERGGGRRRSLAVHIPFRRRTARRSARCARLGPPLTGTVGGGNGAVGRREVGPAEPEPEPRPVCSLGEGPRGELRRRRGVRQGCRQRGRHLIAQARRRVGDARGGERLSRERVDQRPALCGKLAQPRAVLRLLGGAQRGCQDGQPGRGAGVGAAEPVDHPGRAGGLAQRRDRGGRALVARGLRLGHERLAALGERLRLGPVQLRPGSRYPVGDSGFTVGDGGLSGVTARVRLFIAAAPLVRTAAAHLPVMPRFAVPRTGRPPGSVRRSSRQRG